MMLIGMESDGMESQLSSWAPGGKIGEDCLRNGTLKLVLLHKTIRFLEKLPKAIHMTI